MASDGVTLLRRRLGMRLRRMREAAGKTQEDVAASGICQAHKLWRIESGRSGLKKSDVIALAQLYGATPDEAFRLGDLALATAGTGQRTQIPDWFGLFIELEAAASGIETWHPDVVPGLLQTPEYALEVLTHGAEPGVTGDRIERRAQVRLARQTAVIGQHRVDVILGGGALMLQVGDRQVMAAQLDHLRALHSRGAVSIRVMPWSAGPHRGLKGPFTILSFVEDVDPDVVYIETPSSGDYLDEPQAVASYREVFAELRAKSVDLREWTA